MWCYLHNWPSCFLQAWLVTPPSPFPGSLSLPGSSTCTSCLAIGQPASYDTCHSFHLHTVSSIPQQGSTRNTLTHINTHMHTYVHTGRHTQVHTVLIAILKTTNKKITLKYVKRKGKEIKLTYTHARACTRMCEHTLLFNPKEGNKIKEQSDIKYKIPIWSQRCTKTV